MVLHVAMQMDPIENVDISGDTSFALAYEAQERGYAVYVYRPQDLSYDASKVVAHAHAVTLAKKQGAHVQFGSQKELDLAQDIDVIWLRQDPPFDMSYLTTTYLLERLQGQTLVVNNPKGVRAWPEKVLPLDFPKLIPPTLISHDKRRIDAFRAHYKDIVLKPLYGNGGAGVFIVREDNTNYSALLEMFFAASGEPIIAQAFLPAVEKGDKRIILVDGEPIGAINRLAGPGELRTNLHVGGRAEACELTKTDLEICAALGPRLREQGQVLVGIDVIGDRLTEINLTSPTGIVELGRFNDINVAGMVWDAIVKRLKV